MVIGINTAKTTSPSSIASIFGSGVDKNALIIDRLRAFRETPGEDIDASIRWGAAGFEQLENNQDLDSFSVTLKDAEEEEPPPDVTTLVFTEINRKVKVIRVENPNDSDQFVMVEQIENITFDGPDGKKRKFVLTPR